LTKNKEEEKEKSVHVLEKSGSNLKQIDQTAPAQQRQTIEVKT